MAKKKAHHNCILSAVLAFVLLFGALPLSVFSTDNEQPQIQAETVIDTAVQESAASPVQITRDGLLTNHMELQPHEKVDLQVEGAAEDARYQWQILHPEKENLWINIYDATDDVLPVSVALVGNMLNEENVAQLRCRALAGEEERFSAPISVQVLEADKALTVVAEDDAEVLREEPAENTAPTEETTEPTEETTEPSEETAEPTEETAEPTEAPAVVAGDPAAETVPGEPDVETVPGEPDAETPVPENPEAEVIVAPETIQKTNAGVSAQAEGDNADSDFVTVTIEYVRYDILWEDGKMVVDSEGNPVLEDEGNPAFTSYIATLQKGTDLSTSVNNPTMVGYDTYLEDETTPSLKVDINLTNITESVIYTVKYKPAKVNYVVRYYFQNIYDDLYAENATLKPMVNGEGYTGSTPPEDQLRGDVPGFTALFYQPDSIAADGSTVFEVYYERNYYLMEFDCNGGYGAETLYNRYDSYVSVPTPVRPGYVFQGWDLVDSDEPGFIHDDDAEGHLDMMPPYHTAYKALWTTAATTYTVVYWRENADDDGYSYWGSQQINATSNDHVSGTDAALRANNVISQLEDYQYFTYNPVKTQLEEAKRTDLADDGKVVVQGDGSTVVNVYFSRKYYTITIRASGLCTAHIHGDDCEKPLLCGQGDHIHSAECVSTLTCIIPEHTAHTPECIICGKTEHVHGDANCECTLTEHTHTEACCTKEEHAAHTAVSCFTTQSPTLVGTSGDDYNRVRSIQTPVAGRVYKYRYRQFFYQEYTYYNYFYDGTNWYVLGTGTDYAGMAVTITTNNGWNNNYKNGWPTVTCTKEIHTHGDGNCNTGADTCPGMEHTHGDGNCNCSKNEHTHDDSCYKDVIHAHTEDCYSWSCGASAHEHTDECYGECIYPNHTHGSNCTSSSRTNTVKQVTRKYGADISDIWPIVDDNGVMYDDGQRWTPSDSSYYSAVLVFIKNMPGDDFTLTLSEVDYDTFIMHYYVEALNEEDATREYNGKKFVLAFEPVKANYNYITKAEDFFDIAGFSQWASSPAFGSNGQLDINGGGNVYFYYERNVHSLKFHNINTTVHTEPDLMYEYPLKDVTVDGKPASTFVPPYPTTYEPGAYEFGGWYTTPECFPGTEVDWVNGKMPDTDLEIYAKWTPIMRKVTFYSSYSAIGEDEKDTSDRVYHFMKATDVPHGTNLGSTYYDIPEWPGDLDRAENGGPEAELYDFIGWFYLDEDNKKKFAPDSMEVTRDLVLFAEWNTSIDTTYEVKYVLKEAVSAENVPSNTPYPAGTIIADTDAAHASVGKTKTFTAKGLGDLYPDFQKKFFPTVNSHSILMEPQDAEGSQNKFTFEYVYDDTVYYKVRYVDYATRTELRSAKVASTDEAVVTEKFLPIEGYIPQNFYIRKALAYDANATESTVIEENVLTFYYVKDLEHGLYSIEYYRENVGSAYDPNHADAKKPEYFTQFFTQYESIVGSADLKTRITAEPRTYQGYTFVPEMNTVITYKTDGSVDKTSVGVKDINNLPYGTVDYTGLTLKLYFTRNEYPYIIKYVESGSNKELKIVESDSEEFDATVTHTAPAEYVDNKGTATTSDDITYEYYLVDSTTEQRTKEMTIRESAAGAENTLIFYYTQKKVEVQYHAVCLDPNVPPEIKFGAVSINAESATAATGLAGSNATPASGFIFKGWYKDETCETPVDPSWVTSGTQLSPKELYQDEDWINHYYALFEPVKEDLKITKQAAAGTDLGNDTFLFRITGTNALGKAVDMTVSIQGAGSVTIEELYCGDYTVTELTNWSWTYSGEAAKNVELIADDAIAETLVTFTNSSKPVDWLNDESEAKENQFTVKEKTP